MVGSSYTGDIATDDVTFSINTLCSQGDIFPTNAVPQPTQKPPITKPPSSPAPEGFECQFDVDFCGWTNEVDDNFDFVLKSGGTPQLNSGPESDKSGKIHALK